MKPDEVYEVEVEIWPLSLYLPAGSRLTLTVQDKDFERPGETGPTKGVGWMHHTGGSRDAYLLLPVLPAR